MNYLENITATTKALEAAAKVYRLIDCRQVTMKQNAKAKIDALTNLQNREILAAEAAGFTADQINEAIVKGW